MPKVKEKETGIEKFVNSVVDTKGSKAKSVEFFKDALKDKIGSALDARRQGLAKTIMATPEKGTVDTTKAETNDKKISKQNS